MGNRLRAANHSDDDDEKDRHVVATAVSCGASIIVTFNLRHFRKEHLDPWKVIALHPDSFLRALYQQEPAVVRAKLRMQASDRKRTLPELLTILAATVPAFVEQIQSSPEA